MTEKDHYKYGLSGDKVDVEVAERLRAQIRTLAAELAAEKSRLPALGDGYEQLWLRAKTAEDRIRELEAQNTALLADVNQDEGYERMKARNSALEAAAEKVHGIIAEYWGPCMGSVESLLTLREAVGERASTWLPKVSDLPRVATVCTCDSTLVTDTSTHQPHCPRYVAETATWDCVCGSKGHKRGARCLCGGVYENSAVEAGVGENG